MINILYLAEYIKVLESWKDKTGDRSSFFSMAGLTLTEKVNLGVFVGRSAQQSIPLPDGQNSPVKLNMSMC